MTLSDDVTACAQLLERGDPDRFMAAMAAPVAARRVLFPLFAFNVEVARAPWVTQEPMIAEMRLQWWRDALEEIAQGKTPRRHEVVTPLAEVLPPEVAARLDGMIAMRRWDIHKDPFEDNAHFDRYLSETSGTLVWASARALGGGDAAALDDFGYAMGVANWFRAIPELEARGRIPLVDGTPDGIAALARKGLDRLARARKARNSVAPVARAALLPGWQAGAILRQAANDPRRVADGTLGQSGAAKQLSLIWQVATGRF